VRLEPERTLLHCRLVEKIGEGGMGVVGRAVADAAGGPVRTLSDAPFGKSGSSRFFFAADVTTGRPRGLDG
jgi:hypothetical protein